MRIDQIQCERLQRHSARRPKLQERIREGEDWSAVDDIVHKALGDPERTGILTRKDIGRQIIHEDPVSAANYRLPRGRRSPRESDPGLEIILVTVAKRACRKS